jgi:isoquinoline 1-oxidoreductase subunit beta
MMIAIENVSRRTVLTGATIASGLVLGLHLAPVRLFPDADAAQPGSFSPNVYLAIDKTGQVTIVAHRSEMGQGVRT